MTLNALGRGGDAGPRAISPGYRRIIDGLSSFDDLSRSLERNHDAVVRGLRDSQAGSYPQPAYSSPAVAGTVLGAAVAAFVGSESGRAALEAAGSAAVRLIGAIFGRVQAPEQLPLPFE
jgi:hypothetical protein